SGSRYLVVDERLYPRVAGLIGTIPTLEKVFFIGERPPAGTIPIRELLQPSDRQPAGPLEEDDPFVILYTSATPGRPKGCITTNRGTIAQVMGVMFSNIAGAMLGTARMAATGGGQLAGLLTSPLFHVAGLHSTVCTLMTAGAKIVFTSGKFEPER